MFARDITTVCVKGGAQSYVGAEGFELPNRSRLGVPKSYGIESDDQGGRSLARNPIDLHEQTRIRGRQPSQGRRQEDTSGYSYRPAWPKTAWVGVKQRVLLVLWSAVRGFIRSEKLVIGCSFAESLMLGGTREVRYLDRFGQECVECECRHMYHCRVFMRGRRHA